MKKANKFVIASILLSFGVNLLIACAPKGSGGGPANQAGPSAPKSQGTSDSGGCNGVENKCFDSYIIDPTTLPAYKNFVQPLLENIKSADTSKPSTYNWAFKMKLWYLAPVDLENLKKEALGVSFVKSEIQQIALQSMKAIWIDKRIFDKMTEKDQGELLVHELIMSMYFIRFMSLKEMCDLSITLFGKDGNEGCVNPPEYFVKAMPAEKLRPLNEEDNERIRFVTAWLLQNTKKPIQEVDFVRVLKFQGFDKRFFNPDNYGDKKDKPADLKLSKKELMDAINSAKLTGFMPDICSDAENSTSTPCKVEVTESNVKSQSYSIPGVGVKISKDGATLASVVGMLGEETTLSASSDSNGQVVYILMATEWRDLFEVGDQVSMGIIFFRYRGEGPQKQLMLDSVVIKKGVIVSIDKKRNPICRAITPKVKSSFETGFIVHRDSSESLLTEQMFFAVEPIVFCTQENVK